MVAAATIAYTAVNAAPAGAALANGTELGIADNVYDNLYDANGNSISGLGTMIKTYIGRTHPKVYRIQAPYDVATNPAAAGRLASLKSAIAAARSMGVNQVLVTFTMKYSDTLNNSNYPNNVGPSSADIWASHVQAAMAALDPPGSNLVNAWSPANEPNLSSADRWFDINSGTYGPALLGRYYNRLKTLVAAAGDELVSPEWVGAAYTDGTKKMADPTTSLLRAWINKYKAAVVGDDGMGQHAAIHPYAAVTSNNWDSVTEFKSIVGNRDIWFTEVGARIKGGEMPANPPAQQVQAANLVNWLKVHGEVSRAYYYMPAGGSTTSWDSALLDDYGVPRPTWSVWCAASRTIGLAMGGAPCPTALTAPDPGFTLAPDEYRIARSGADVGSVLTPQFAQQFKAADVGLKSIAFMISPPNPLSPFIFTISKDGQQVASKTVTSTNTGNGLVTAVFDAPLQVTKGASYVVRVATQSGANFTPSFSVWDEDSQGNGAQYNWDNSNFNGPDVVGRITTTSDLTPPTAPSIASATPRSGGGEVDLAWSASTDNVGIGGYDVYVDGVLKYTTTATSQLLSGLGCQASHTVRVVARDTVGNSATSTDTNVTTTACTPLVTITSPVQNQILPSAVNVVFTVTKNAATSVMCSRDGGTATACSSPVALSGLSNGAHTFAITASNTSGAHTATVTFDVDAIPPVLTFSSPAAGTVPSQVVRVMATANEPITGKSCALDGSSTFTACDFADWSTLFDTGGAHSVTIKANDLVGNTATATRSFVIDAPVVTITSPTQGATVPSEVLTVTGSVDRPVVKTECSDGPYEVYQPCDISNWPRSYAYMMMFGATQAIKVRVTDASGNVGYTKRTFTISPSTIYISSGNVPMRDYIFPWIASAATAHFSATPSAAVLAAGGGQSYTFICNGSIDCTNGYAWAAEYVGFDPVGFGVEAIDNKGFVSTASFNY